jgi:hypothetical protein
VILVVGEGEQGFSKQVVEFRRRTTVILVVVGEGEQGFSKQVAE